MVIVSLQNKTAIIIRKRSILFRAASYGLAIMDVHLIRLDVIRDQVQEHINICKSALARLREGNCSSHQARVVLVPLRTKTNRYVTEIHLYLKNMVVRDSEAIVLHTHVQMEAEALIEEIEDAIRSSSHSSHMDNVTSKLPKLELLKFNGEVLKWHEFWDRFSSSVHNKNIRNVDKLAYLNGCLLGKAKEAIVGLETTDTNYEIALNVLQERFGKPAVVIDAHYRELFKLKSKNDNITEARRVINEIERHLRVLKSLGEDAEGAYLRNVIIEKFPKDIVKELRMRMSSEGESVPIIRKHLEHIVTAREASDQNISPTFSTEVLHIHEKRENYTRKQFNKTKFSTPLAQRQNTDFGTKKRGLEGNFNKYGKRLRMSCIFCEGSHYNDECRTVPSLEARKKKLMNKCYICFRKGHKSSDCKLSRKCVHCGQINSHNRALCPKKLEVQTYVARTFQTREEGTLGVLQTAIVKVEDKDCRILLDTGSQRTYVTRALVNKLKLQTKHSNRLLVYTFGTDKPKEIESSIVNITITTRRGGIFTVQANEMPYITNEVFCPTDCIKSHLDYDLADDGSLGTGIDILIGNDYYGMFMTNRTERIGEGLYLIDSCFGWIYSGRVEIENVEQDMTIVTYCDGGTGDYFTRLDPPLKEAHICQLWDLETIGIRDPPKTTQQEEVVKHFNQNVKVEQNRYQVKWPYILFPPDLPTNFGLAYGRLKSIVQRMDKEMLEDYDAIFKQQLNDGIIEVVKFTPTPVREMPVHYLPHHGVKHEGKKLRIVLDASAKTKNESSLNECLYKGPLMLEDLTALLIKFRQHSIAITADIEKAFLQLSLQPDDRDVTRMLWLKDTEQGVHEQNLLHIRFCRVPFGIISSPFLLTATIHHHINQSDPKMNMVEKVAKRCYVDNLVTGADSKSEAIKLYHNTKRTFSEISMNMRDWNSNDKDFLKEVPEQFRENNSEKTNILGMKWDTKRDTLSLKGGNKLLSETLMKKAVTKRQVLRVLASLYDPCGFLSPLVLPCKVFLQSLWREKENWDTKLNEEKQEQWLKLQESLKELDKYEFPRYLGHNDAKDLELHCFTDASKDAYAAVVYLRAAKQQVTISLIMSKSRLTPLKEIENLKIPRLELLGCLIGTRLLRYVRKNLDLNITRQILWTDSTIVLDWIATNKLLPPFVARRIDEITKDKDIEFRYVDTRQNPADIASRKEGERRLAMWLEGPKFLQRHEECWPKRPRNNNQTNVLAIGEGLVEEPEILEEGTIMDRSMENEAELMENEKNRETTEEIKRRNNNEKEVEEDEQTLKAHIKRIQKEHYPHELAGNKTSLKLNLNLFKDEEGLLRCEGRIGKSTLSYNTKCPILLPGDCELTKKIIQDIHVNNYHVGTSHTLSLVRQQYWIPKGRNEVKKVLKRCPVCVKHGGGPFKLPDMPQLPKERVTFEKPFDFVGMDYFGPVLVTCEERTQKVWVVLYTCLAIRAIHMEIVKNLTADECLLALRRFIAARGVPVLITSDNAPQFKITAEVLDSEYCLKRKIKWRFIPELAPWHGGFYERLIGIVKNCLKRTLDKHMLNDNQFLTVIKEVEAVLNTRPMTYVSTEQEHILRPNDFIAMGKCLTVEESGKEVLDTERVTKMNLIEGWKRGMYILKEFEKMFINQYLLGLRERCQKNKEGRINVKRLPQVGEVVQIKDEATNRMCWKVGKIVEVIKGKDDQVRVAIVNVEGTRYRRSIAHLYPLEMEDEDVIEAPDESVGVDRNKEDTIKIPVEIIAGERISRRNASEKAREKIKKWTKQLFINVMPYVNDNCNN